ncbi:hypothetical protein SAMN05877753_10948 [Bacillus oleivorans]|uniref:Uncharacterized protein n=1 Tax=Bacillus oleivorans TaxID=1448271 RepID=A0A285D4U5_9BACI|nr:hypothetical protein SAMN05877753_10948 [Bacillus oleivorans]
MNQDLLKFLEDLSEESEVVTAEEIEAAQLVVKW